MLYDNSNKYISSEEEYWEDDYCKTGNSKITIKKDRKQSIKSLVNKLFNKNDDKYYQKMNKLRH
jgi:hypothetical protein